MGINILYGLSVYAPLAAGQISLGNAGFAALGAYLAAVLTASFHWPVVPAVISAGLLAAAVGAAVGFPALRLRGMYLIMATLAFGEIVESFFLNWNYTGGALGFHGASEATLPLVWGIVALCLAGFWLLDHSRMALAYRATESDEVAAELMGTPLARVKIGGFMIGAFVAGVGGALLALYVGYIQPTDFDFLASVNMALFVILGGTETFWGAVLGAAIFTALPEFLRFSGEWRITIYGGLLLMMVILRPRGILNRTTMAWFVGLVRRGGRTPEPASASPAATVATAVRMPPPPAGRDGRPLLQVAGVRVRFGGVQALNGVDLEVHPGEFVGLIGPNGSGKTTLFNAITQVVRADEGSVRLDGTELLGLPPWRVTGLGVARTFQTIRLFRRMSVLENVLVAQNIHAGWGMPRGDFSEAAEELLQSLRLWPRRHEMALRLSYGEQRRLEVARAVAARPRVLLLDEPVAGMNSSESQALLDDLYVLQVRHDLAVLLIEHDMRFVMESCSRVYVLHFGERIAAGTPAEVQADERVISAYLGTKGGQADGTRPVVG